MRRVSSVLIGAAALFALGCGGSDRATARPTSTATPSASPAATATATPTAVAAKPGLRLKRIGTFDNPVFVTAPPGDRNRIFVVEQGGTVRIVRNGKKLARAFLDISGSITSGGERGLLSLAFAPNYRSSGRFYVYFTAKNGDLRVVEYRRGSANRANLNKRRRLLSVTHPAGNHNGGQLQFGPDGLLYAGLGDGGGAGDRHGSRGNAQNLGTLLGKIVRLQPTGRPRPQIYAYGLRNPWRFSFAPSGNLVIGDVGQNAVEEIDIASRRGQNFGWRVFEGRSRYAPGESAPGAIPPVIQRFHSDGNCSIIGGVVVRDPVLSALRGRYVFSDFCTGVIESARISGTQASDVKATRLHVDSLSAFGVDGRRRTYVASLSGPVYRLVPR
ncbi:MAG TPA: PQQ-dependent sugar dehydrogenase [Solirubrobacteraceae bacterium]|nr:PQQ-dependent sugar dehydrogenase [Solirubrobacteraceae bacterium]